MRHKNGWGVLRQVDSEQANFRAARNPLVTPDEGKTCPCFAESVQGVFRTVGKSNPQPQQPARNAAIRLVTFG